MNKKSSVNFHVRFIGVTLARIMPLYRMIQLKNIRFTRLFKADGRLREFNFRKSEGIKEPRFTIEVAREIGERQYLFFRFTNQHWILENKKLVPWIEEILPQIEEVIHTHT